MSDMETEKEKKKRRKQLHRVLKTHPEFELTFDMQVGIRHILGMEQGGVKEDTLDAPPTIKDFEEVIKLDFPKDGSKNPPYTVPHSSRDFSFKTYAPKIFRKIRERFGIRSIPFITSVCGNFEYLSFKTNSKSGQFFFYSHDKRYMLKTMTGAECKLLMKILPSYYQHVMEEPNTLLCRFYGMHRVKPSGRGSFHFLIMESVFNTNLEIHQIFDLKGSRVNRFAKRGESVYKDIDFLENNFNFKLPTAVAEKVKNVIESDTRFLKNAMLMDYSLLVGVHYRDGKPKTIEYKQDRIRRMKEKKEKTATQTPLGVPKKYNIISQPAKANVQMSQGDLNDEKADRKHKTSGPAIALDDVKPEIVVGGGGQDGPGIENMGDGLSSPDIVIPELTGEEFTKPRKSILPAHHGGLRSVEANGEPGSAVFYVGIIDILTEYGVRKGLEHRVTSMFKDGNLISCVHPNIYGNRFKDFLFSRIEPVEMKEAVSPSVQTPLTHKSAPVGPLAEVKEAVSPSVQTPLTHKSAPVGPLAEVKEAVSPSVQ
eukprot:CAMPEP_0167827888 /NCGR_PEP_ID=MMETSP0112_2-20121227/11005_1 /TAXON_ID=91324 /ORGANISM="Lotharella globosa, Strain CCCM811" /LENGTH=537 /DNA_ID=CAMNT_0007730823 /DNA_START=65 /DNA_END=1675 /DNA_ORIENTATION=-